MIPTYGMLSGWTTHRRMSCLYCMDQTDAFQIKMVTNLVGLIVIKGFYHQIMFFARTKGRFERVILSTITH